MSCFSIGDTRVTVDCSLGEEFMKLHRLFLSSCALVMFAVAPAFSATIATYTDRTTWQGVSSGVQTVTFENFSPASGLSSVTWDNVTFTGTKNASPAVLQIFDTSVLSFYNFGTHYALAMSPYGGQTFTFHIALPDAVTSFGVDLFSGSPSSLSYTVNVAGNPYTVPTFPAPTAGFFGATFDAPITSVDISAPGAPDNSLLFLDNFSFGAAATSDQTPEVDTLLMIGTGLTAVAAMRRRSRT